MKHVEAEVKSVRCSAHMLCREVEEASWSEIAARFRDQTFEQTATYGAAAAARIGASARFVAIEEAGGICAAACLRVKKAPRTEAGIAWIAAGPLLLVDDTEAVPGKARLEAILGALRAFCDERNWILRVRLSPVVAVAGQQGGGLAVEALSGAGFSATRRAPSYTTVLVDLTRSEDELLSDQHQKWRNAMRGSQKHGIEIDALPMTAAAGRFERLYGQFRQEKEFSVNIPPDFYYELDGKDFWHEALIARAGGEDIAAVSLGGSHTNATFLFGATPAPGRRVNAGYYLIWEAIRRLRGGHLRHFDLGGIDATENASVARFKTRAGGVRVTSSGPFQALATTPRQRGVLLAEYAFSTVKKILS